jgi:hypothetical protein
MKTTTVMCDNYQNIFKIIIGTKHSFNHTMIPNKFLIPILIKISMIILLVLANAM